MRRAETVEARPEVVVDVAEAAVVAEGVTTSKAPNCLFTMLVKRHLRMILDTPLKATEQSPMPTIPAKDSLS